MACDRSRRYGPSRHRACRTNRDLLMFTGIVEVVGLIEDVRSASDGVRVTIAAADIGLSVVANDGRSLMFDVSGETIRCTAPLERGRRVHLEKSLRLAERLGGHLVAGH